MNWCKEHWDYLKQVLEAKGLDRFIGDGAKDGIAGLMGERFDPLMGSWDRITAYMLQSKGLNGRILMCPLCILVVDGQPELVKRWVDGCTNNALDYAVEQGLMDHPSSIVVPEPPIQIGTRFEGGGHSQATEKLSEEENEWMNAPLGTASQNGIDGNPPVPSGEAGEEK